MTEKKNLLLDGARFMLAIFVFYMTYIKEAFGNYPILLYGTVVMATGLIFVDVLMHKGKIPLVGFPFVLLLYGVYAFVTGFFISRDTSWFLSSMVTYFAFSVVCFDCCYIIKRTGSGDWLFRAFLISAVACSIQTIFFGVDYKTEVIVRTMSSWNNPNYLGFIMIIGIFALISRKKKVVNRFWLSMAVTLVFLYVILLSASRKCFFCAAALIAIWIFSVLRTDKQMSLKRISIVFAILAGFGIVVYFFAVYYSSTSSFARMLLMESGLSTRTQLIRDAITYWESSPVFGIGFGQYQIWSPNRFYSHSSYAEILCCTGIIGTLILFLPLLHRFVGIAKATFGSGEDNRYDFSMCLALAVVELMMGIGQIYVYDVAHLLILSYLCLSVDLIRSENQSLNLQEESVEIREDSRYRAEKKLPT